MIVRLWRRPFDVSNDSLSIADRRRIRVIGDGDRVGGGCRSRHPEGSGHGCAGGSGDRLGLHGRVERRFREDRAVVRRLELVLFFSTQLFHSISVGLVLPVGALGLEDLDLTKGRVKEFGNFVAVRISVDLNSERNALLPAVLLGGELGGKAVDWSWGKFIFRRTNI